MVKVTDDLLMSGEQATITDFIRCFKRRLVIRKSLVDADLVFNGCEIYRVI